MNERPTSNLVVILKNDAGEEFYPAFVVDAQRAEIERCKERAVDAELEMSVQRVTIERLTRELEEAKGPTYRIRQAQAEEIDLLEIERGRLRAALDLIAGTHGIECANPRMVAAQALRPADEPSNG